LLQGGIQGSGFSGLLKGLLFAEYASSGGDELVALAEFGGHHWRRHTVTVTRRCQALRIIFSL
jgi:hypothetical protein